MSLRWYGLVLLFALMAFPVHGRGDVRLPGERITMEGIFEAGRYTRALPEITWIEGGAAYLILEEEGDISGDLIRHDVETGKASVWIRAGDLTPAGAKKRLHVEGFRVSADDRYVLLLTDRKKRWRHTHTDVHWIYDRKSESLRRLSAVGRQHHAFFSPDGSRVGFVQEGDLFVVDTAGGLPRALTQGGSATVTHGDPDWVYEEEFGLEEAWWWSPEGQRIAYLRFDASSVESFPLVKTGKDAYPELRMIRYPKSGSDNSTVSLHVVDLSTQETKQVARMGPKGDYIARVDWTGEGGGLVYQRVNRAQNRLDLTKYDADSGRERVLLTETSRDGWIDVSDDLTFLEGGRFLWTSSRTGWNHVYEYGAEGKELRALTEGENNVRSIEGVLAGDVVLVTVNPGPAVGAPHERHLMALPLRGMKEGDTLPSSSGGGWHEANVAPDGRHFLQTSSSAVTPRQLVMKSAQGKATHELADEATEAFGKLALGEHRFLTVPGPEGTTLRAQMILPPGFREDVPHPVVMFCYGGPGSQLVRDYWYGSRGRGLFHHMLAQEGFVVFTADGRGTFGQGRAFENLVYRKLGQLEADDQLAVARWLQRQSFVDPERIAVWGWSYGGYLSAMTLLRSEGEVRSAISVAPVSDWRFYDTIYTERYMGTPAQNAEGYAKGSLLEYVDGLAGKQLLVIHGTGDDNVHPQNTLRLISELQEGGHPFELMIYPDKAHGIAGQPVRQHLFTLMHDFLHRTLATQPKPLAPSASMRK